MKFTITPVVQDELVNLARMRDPLEACGILVGLHPLYFNLCELENVAPNPTDTFLIHPKDYRDATQMQPGADLALWHSHPRSRATPSPSDEVLLRAIKLPMVIVSLRPYLKIAAFVIAPDGRVQEVGRWRPKVVEPAVTKVRG